jgi:hypothetical protein
MAKPRVFVSSTFYDLKYIRDNIHTFLTERGFETILNEKGHIPYDKNITLQSNCFEEVKSCDILIGIIGNRFGTELEFDNEKSVTMNEIETAFENNKQIFLFIENETWHENIFYEQNMSNDNIVYKANVKIHKFLYEIKRKKRNNSLHPFTSIDNIIDFLNLQFSGFFLRGLRNITNEDWKNGISIFPISAEETKEVIQPTVKHQDNEYNFSIHYPQDWKLLYNPIAYFCVAGPSNDGFTPSITITLLPHNKNFFQTTIQDLQKEYEVLWRNVKIKNFGMTKIGRKNCLRCHVQLTGGEDLNLEIAQLLFQHKGKTFVVTATDKQTNIHKSSTTFMNIFDSLQFSTMKGKLRKKTEKFSEIKDRFHYRKKYYRSNCYYEFTLVKFDSQYFLSDQGNTYEMLDKIFELKEPDVKKNLNAIAKECEVVITEDERLVIPLDFWNDSPNDEQRQLLEEAKCKMFTCVAFMDTMRIFYV